MRVRIRLPKAVTRKILIWGGWTSLAVFVVGLVTFFYFWNTIGKLIDARMSGDIFDHAARIYSAPRTVAVGQRDTLEHLAAQLRRFGYSGPDEPTSRYGSFVLDGNVLEVRPGEDSVVGPGEALRIEARGGKIVSLTALHSRTRLNRALIDPEHVTNLFDSNRSKRRLITYADIPTHLVQALLTAEDRRFFNHPGISVLDGMRVLYYDLGIWLGFREGGRPHGASTLNMQLARSYFLEGDMTLSWRRKIFEAIVALQLERRFSKEKILELYANEVYLGHKGSFSIHGFGEASQAYFGKDVSQLSLAESAMLAGLIRGPNLYNPYRNPEYALNRRNLILDGMVSIETITEAEAEEAKAEEIVLAPLNVEASDAPYFVDLVRDNMLEQFSEEDLIAGDYRVYTTLDPDLQIIASEAVQATLSGIDEKIAARYAKRGKEPPKPEITLVALDPQTGAIRALVGGRDYTRAQLNHATVHRPVGSAFKPFVFGAAFSKALDDPDNPITPATTVVDEPTVFLYGNEEYSPGNFGEKFYGVVTAREALVRSLNVATVKIAEMTGYDRVASLAIRAGLNSRLRPTPAMAIGAYDSTPVEVAGAYTVFANQGKALAPGLIESILSSRGTELFHRKVEPVEVLDPRAAYLVLDLMADNLNRGTGAGARSRGFYAPGAGKTGTSHDAWFVGFTSNLIAVVWVGFDDYRDLGLAGSTAALPIWAEFMKNAVELPAYSDTEDFVPPEGIISVPVDPETWQIARLECPVVRSEYFLVGTEPTDLCPLHSPSILRRFSQALSGALGISRRPRPEAKEDEKDKEPGEPDGKPGGNAVPPPDIELPDGL